RADRQRRSARLDEFAEEERHVVVPRDAPKGRKIELRERIRKPGVPAGPRRVVVALVVRVPAEDDVAEAEARFDRGKKLLLVQILSAQDAVGVGHCDLDPRRGRVANLLDDAARRWARNPGHSIFSRKNLPLDYTAGIRLNSFDYIIVGAGSAGCVLANRLTADGRSTVLLLEAGPRDTNPWIHVPLGYGKLFKDTSVNWSYWSEPEPHLNNRKIFTPRGKVLGGSSSINGLVYMRGQREDFDEWKVPGWGFDDLLPYFIKSEDQQRGANQWHGVGGPLAVS